MKREEQIDNHYCVIEQTDSKNMSIKTTETDNDVEIAQPRNPATGNKVLTYSSSIKIYYTIYCTAFKTVDVI